MEIEKKVNEESYLIGIPSQKKGRFIIQEIEEENSKIFFSSKKYSFDSKRIIFSYFTYDYNSNFLSQTDYNNSNNNNIHKLKSTYDLNEMEKQSRLGSLNSKKDFADANFHYINNDKECNININKRKTSEENYFSGENNYNNNNYSPIQIKTYVLGIEDENHNFLDFELIWKQFIERNKINLFNNLDKRIFRYHKPSQDKWQLFAGKKSSSFLSSDLRSQISQDTQNKKIEKQISHSSLKKFSRYNSEIKLLTNKNQNNNSRNALHWSQNLEKIEKRTLSAERMSIFKRNSMNTFCSSFSKKMINFNNNNNATCGKEKRMSTLNNAFYNKDILALHSNFKSDLEINYGLEENEDTEGNLMIKENRKLPLKKLSKNEIIKTFPHINKTEAESFKGKVLEIFKIDGKSKKKETECEINIDITSSELDSDSKKPENKNEDDSDENKLNKKSNYFGLDNGTKEDNLSNDEFCDGNETDVLFKFHSHGVNLDINKRMYIEDDIEDRGLKAKFSLELNKNNNNNNNNNNKTIAFKEEQESDLLIPKVNFDSDKNIVSDVNPFLTIEGCNSCNINPNNHNLKDNSNVNLKHEKLRKERVFEKELNEINERNSKKSYLENKNNYNNRNYVSNLEDLLKSPLETLLNKDSENTFNNKKYKSWNLNLDMKSIENLSQQSYKKDFYPHNRESPGHSNKTNKHDIFALEEEEDHFYFSCSSINTPKSKAIVAKNQQNTKLSDPHNNTEKPKIIGESPAEDFSLKKNKTLKIKIPYFINKGEKNKQASSPKKNTNTIPKYECGSNKLINKINFEVNKKFKNPNNAKLNIIKSIQKSFVEDEKQNIGLLISRINSADKKFNCVKLKKTEIEKTQFEILPSIINKSDLNEIDKKCELEESEEEEEQSDTYENLQVIQVISIELCGDGNKLIENFDTKINYNKENFCKECKCKQG